MILNLQIPYVICDERHLLQIRVNVSFTLLTENDTYCEVY